MPNAKMTQAASERTAEQKTKDQNASFIAIENQPMSTKRYGS